MKRVMNCVVMLMALAVSLAIGARAQACMQPPTLPTHVTGAHNEQGERDLTDPEVRVLVAQILAVANVDAGMALTVNPCLLRMFERLEDMQDDIAVCLRFADTPEERQTCFDWGDAEANRILREFIRCVGEQVTAVIRWLFT